MMLSRWNKADHPVAVTVFAVVMVLLGVAALILIWLVAALDDLQIFPECFGNC